MNSLARSLEGQSSDGTYAPSSELTADVLKRRVVRRRQMLTIQAASYALNSLVLLIYAYAGTLSIAVPSSYFLSGIMLTGFFARANKTPVTTTVSPGILPWVISTLFALRTPVFTFTKTAFPFFTMI